MNIGKTFSDVLRFVDLFLLLYFQSNIIIMNFGRPIFDHQIIKSNDHCEGRKNPEKFPQIATEQKNFHNLIFVVHKGVEQQKGKILFEIGILLYPKKGGKNPEIFLKKIIESTWS